jgi:hypothetical protein
MLVYLNRPTPIISTFSVDVRLQAATVLHFESIASTNWTAPSFPFIFIRRRSSDQACERVHKQFLPFILCYIFQFSLSADYLIGTA